MPNLRRTTSGKGARKVRGQRVGHQAVVETITLR
jgi:hypothetical protein